jgi:hypothetical protein
MASQSPTESGITQLWKAAVLDYEEATGKSLQLAQFGNMDDIMASTEGLSKNFKEFRSDNSKVAKVRTAFKNNMWLIQNVVNTLQRVGNAASVSFDMAIEGHALTTLYRPSRQRCQPV